MTLGLIIGASGRVLEQSNEGKGAGKRFLSEELPLKIIATTPTSLLGSQKGKIRLGKQQELTVQFRL